jgi:hypothetical protein
MIESFSDPAFRTGFFCAFSVMTALWAIAMALSTAIKAHVASMTAQMDEETAEWTRWELQRREAGL